MGLERLKKGKPAGISTYGIICLSSCYLTILSVYVFGVNSDPSRLISNIITGIGVLAGGTILSTSNANDDKVKIKGLTTAATIFCVAALGIGIGIGEITLTIFIVALVELNILISIKLKKYFKDKIDDNDYDDF